MRVTEFFVFFLFLSSAASFAQSGDLAHEDFIGPPPPYEPQLKPSCFDKLSPAMIDVLYSLKAGQEVFQDDLYRIDKENKLSSNESLQKNIQNTIATNSQVQKKFNRLSDKEKKTLASVMLLKNLMMRRPTAQFLMSKLNDCVEEKHIGPDEAFAACLSPEEQNFLKEDYFKEEKNFSATLKDHMQAYKQPLQDLREAGAKLSAKGWDWSELDLKKLSQIKPHGLDNLGLVLDSEYLTQENVLDPHRNEPIVFAKKIIMPYPLARRKIDAENPHYFPPIIDAQTYMKGLKKLQREFLDDLEIYARKIQQTTRRSGLMKGQYNDRNSNGSPLSDEELEKEVVYKDMQRVLNEMQMNYGTPKDHLKSYIAAIQAAHDEDLDLLEEAKKSINYAAIDVLVGGAVIGVLVTEALPAAFAATSAAVALGAIYSFVGIEGYVLPALQKSGGNRTPDGKPGDAGQNYICMALDTLDSTIAGKVTLSTLTSPLALLRWAKKFAKWGLVVKTVLFGGAVGYGGYIGYREGKKPKKQHDPLDDVLKEPDPEETKKSCIQLYKKDHKGQEPSPQEIENCIALSNALNKILQESFKKALEAPRTSPASDPVPTN